MSSFSKDQATQLVTEANEIEITQTLMVAPDVYHGLKRHGVLGQLTIPYIINPRLLEGRWEFTENPPAKLAARTHGPVMEHV